MATKCVFIVLDKLELAELATIKSDLEAKTIGAKTVEGGKPYPINFKL